MQLSCPGRLRPKPSRGATWEAGLRPGYIIVHVNGDSLGIMLLSVLGYDLEKFFYAGTVNKHAGLYF